MGIVITGIGPRCGTSAAMREVISRGYTPHRLAEKFPSYTAAERNPLGFWDISLDALESDETFALGENEAIKLWSPQFKRVDWTTVDQVIVMWREDITSQIESILLTAEAEGFTPSNEQVERMFWEPRVLLKDIDVPKQFIEIEDLRLDPYGVLDTIKEVV
ncbi:MAG: hypothetical protein GY871_07410 [Actinomycetales bacterium]|nr:hypothetical protein [Actinomycetales bacterium]